jgi:hypothetical protein
MLTALALPALLPLVFSAVSAWSQGLVPTGFIQYDMAYYPANAREHFDHGWTLTYGNPYAPAGTPAIYFQPHILFLAILQALGLPPAIAFNLFGLFALALATAAAAGLYDELVGLDTRAKRIGLLCFFWGGGVLSLLGLAFGLASGGNLARSLFLFDPNDGWWMLNFGRNLVYPTEAYYHGVFLLAILHLVRRRFGPALAFTALLSASHPFTGLTLVLIVAGYAAMELLLKSDAANLRLLFGAALITGFHVVYYLVFLNRSPDHRALRSQWELDWPYAAWTFGPALYLVGLLAFTRFTRWKTTRAVLTDSRSRLLLVWFAVVFALTQHDAFLKPMQPIHFAHGYDWMALFFLAAPVLIPMLEKLSKPAVAFCVVLMLSDNLLWFASFASPQVQRYAISLTTDEYAVLQWLRENATSHDVVASDDSHVNYLASTYSAARSWMGHVHNTPHASQRQREVTAMTFPSPGPNLFVLRHPHPGAQPTTRIGQFFIHKGPL